MHILYDEQGSDEWHASRLGVATASCFNEIMTTKQLKRAKSQYIYLLAAEAITGDRQDDDFDNKHMQRGRELEPEAIAWYEYQNSVEVVQCGLCLAHEGGLYGMSPDGLIGENGGLEIKAPELKRHLKYKAEGVVPDEYLHQVYGCLYVSGRYWWDFMSYHTKSQPLVVRTTKDDPAYVKWAAAFDKVLPEFLTDLKKIIQSESE
jgi:hypothetical protein